MLRATWSRILCAAVVACATLPGRLMLVACPLGGAERQQAESAAPTSDVSTLRKLAEIEDISGTAAPEAYARLAEALAQSASRSTDYLAVLERGLTVSLRENKPEQAEWFRQRLQAAGRVVAAPGAGRRDAAGRNVVWIPGGLQALAFVAHANENSSPEHFLADYCRAVADHTMGNEVQRKLYMQRIRSYFERLAALQALGTRKGNRATVTVAAGADSQTDKILRLLGWKMRPLRNRATMEADEKTQQGRRQESAVALAVDGVAMQEALEAGKPYSFDIISERAPVLLDEETWRKRFYANERQPGGFAEAVARDPRLARAYVGLAALNEPARAALLASATLPELVEKHSSLLYQYSSALVVDEGRVLVPGGKRAEPFWQQLVGASPGEPRDFLRALFEKERGALLAYFFTLFQLDAGRQRFSTRNAARLNRFYGLFREASGLQPPGAPLSVDNTWVEMLREVPLDGEGRVRFPGSARVWQVARGISLSSPEKSTALARKLGAAVAPEAEDELLEHLARTRYTVGGMPHAQLENFLAVSRLEAHRTEPLTEGAALLLAQNVMESEGAYPYFATLTALTERDFERFFALRDKIRDYPPAQQNVALGQAHALIQLLCLLRESGAIQEKRAAELFGLLCERFLAAGSPADWTRSSLEFVRQLLPAQAADPDDALRVLLLGQPQAVSFPLNGVVHQVDAAKIRDARFRGVLEAQKAPALGTLFRIYDAARKLATGTGDAAEHLRAVEADAAILPAVEVPKKLQLAKIRHSVEMFLPQSEPVLARLRKQAGSRKQAEGLVQQLLAEINPQVTLALAGLVYAYYLGPDDLLVSEDPLLLRKHQYLPPGERKDTVFFGAELHASSEDPGSYFTGGFADFSTSVGRLGAFAIARADPMSGPVFSAQVASIRSAQWQRLRDEDLRLLGLKVRAASEWVVQAARDPALASALSDAAVGLLSPGRRAELLNALRAQDWATVWPLLSLSDLYFLGDAYLRRFPADPWPSPVTRALREASALNPGFRLEALGPQTRALRGCSHAHLAPLAPYEEYERYIRPEKLAERVAEFKLYLAYYMDRRHIPAAAFGVLAEPAAESIFQKLRMTTLRDWRSVLAALRSLDDDVIEEALGRL